MPKPPKLTWTDANELVARSREYYAAGWVPASYSYKIVGPSECPRVHVASQVILQMTRSGEEHVLSSTRVLVPTWAYAVANCKAATSTERKFWLNNLLWHDETLNAVSAQYLLADESEHRLGFPNVVALLRAVLPAPTAEVDADIRRQRARARNRI